jgi:hypothetical protein
VTEEGAYEREMGSLRGLSANEQDRLLAGHAPHADAQLDEVATFMRALRAALPAQPDEHGESDLVPRLAEVSATASQADRDRVTVGVGLGRAHARSRLGFVARVGVAVALLPALLASLAFAGVTLPDPARDAFEAVGVDLPNQAVPSDESADDAGDAVPRDDASKQNSAEDGVSGGGNSSEAHQKALQKRKKARGKAVGHTRGKAIGLNEAVPPGQSSDTGPSDHSSSGGSASSGSAGSESAPGRLNKSLPPSTRGKGHLK